MKKVAVYPLDYRIKELIINDSLLDGYEISFFIKRDIFSNHNISNINPEKITHDYKLAISEVDILLMDSCSPQIPPSEYQKLISVAQKHNKTILLTDCLYKELNKKNVIKVSDNIQILKNDVANPYDNAVNRLSLSNINIPIISVLGLGKYCDKFQCELTLRDFFLKKGYNVLQFGSKDISPIFGFQCMPSFIEDSTLPFYNRTIGFNKFITNQIEKEKPDLIILGLDEPILPYSSKILNGLGEIPLIVSSAINTDISIINIYNQDHITKEYISHLLSCGKYRLNASNTYINVSGTMADVQDDHRGLKYYHINKILFSINELNESIGENKVFTLGTQTSKSELLETIFNRLTNNIDIF